MINIGHHPCYIMGEYNLDLLKHAPSNRKISWSYVCQFFYTKIAYWRTDSTTLLKSFVVGRIPRQPSLCIFITLMFTHMKHPNQISSENQKTNFTTGAFNSRGRHKAQSTETLTLGLRENRRHFADDIFKFIFLNENKNFTEICFTKGPMNNIPALVQIMAWNRPGGKPLSEPMMVSLLTHIDLGLNDLRHCAK